MHVSVENSLTLFLLLFYEKGVSSCTNICILFLRVTQQIIYELDFKLKNINKNSNSDIVLFYLLSNFTSTPKP